MPDQVAPGDSTTLRILHGLNGTLLGGAELVAISLGVQLRARGDEVLFSVAAQGVALDECRRLGFAAVEAPQRLDTSAVSAKARMAAGLAALTSRLAFPRRASTVLHAHGPGTFRTMGIAARLARVPTICHIHSIPDAAVLRWSFRRMPTVVVPCAAFLRETIERSFEGRRTPLIVPLPCAVDSTRFFPPESRAAARVALGLPAATELVVVLADLSPNKGIDVAIRAFGRAAMGRPSARLWIVGEERVPCGHREALLQLVRDSNLDRQVEFLGFRRDTNAILRGAEVLLLASRSEGMPLSVLEAQASAVPVIASPVGGLPEIITHGVTGWLVPHDDVEGWAVCLRTLLENPSLRASVGEAAARRARENHSLTAYTTRMREIYNQALERVR